MQLLSCANLFADIFNRDEILRNLLIVFLGHHTKMLHKKES